VGMNRAVDSAIGLPNTPASASEMLGSRMPDDVRRNLMNPLPRNHPHDGDHGVRGIGVRPQATNRIFRPRPPASARVRPTVNCLRPHDNTGPRPRQRQAERFRLRAAMKDIPRTDLDAPPQAAAPQETAHNRPEPLAEAASGKRLPSSGKAAELSYASRQDRNPWCCPAMEATEVPRQRIGQLYHDRLGGGDDPRGYQA
jgi:hypothetical protein